MFSVKIFAIYPLFSTSEAGLQGQQIQEVKTQTFLFPSVPLELSLGEPETFQGHEGIFNKNESFAFSAQLPFTSMDQCITLITADEDPICMSLSRFNLPSFMNKTLRYLNSSTSAHL